MIIYFDMDGVLCDFKGKILKTYGKPYHKSMWKDIAEHHPRIFVGMKPFENMVVLANSLAFSGGTVKVLTARPSMAFMEHVEQDKRDWCSKHLNKEIEVIVTEKAVTKQLYSNRESILIDDSNINILQWVSHGGIGIHHENFEQTSVELFKHLNKTEKWEV